MSNVLEFRASHSASEGRVSGAHVRGAEIVIFPGVRYERMSDPVPPLPEPEDASGPHKKSRRGSRRSRS